MNKPSFPPQSTNIVECRGESLHPILWQGVQWAVTEYGVECRDGTYVIDSVWYFQNNKPSYPWPRHMEGKNWVNIDDFKMACSVLEILFNKNGKRNSIAAPILLDEKEIEEYAIQHGDQAYRQAKDRAMRGEI